MVLNGDDIFKELMKVKDQQAEAKLAVEDAKAMTKQIESGLGVVSDRLGSYRNDQRTSLKAMEDNLRELIVLKTGLMEGAIKDIIQAEASKLAGGLTKSIEKVDKKADRANKILDRTIWTTAGVTSVFVIGFAALELWATYFKT